MNSFSKNILYDGQTESRPKPLQLCAGNITMVFEPDTVFLRHLRLGDHEIVRAIYGAVRDHNWRTINPKLSNLKWDSNTSSFEMTFDAECKEDDIDFFWKGRIRGDAKGKVIFDFDGEARSAFLRNRIGVCVLHPIVECAGKPCTIERVDGTTEQGAFPRYISPHQPFKQIRAISYEVAPGARAEVRFEGETFEMEDQRNWTDASFKTYSTPLELPMPVRVEKGTRIQQSVTVSLVGEQRKVLAVVQGRPPQLSISTTPVLPKQQIGLKVATHGQPLSAREIELLKRLRLSHLRLDLKLSGGRYAEALRRASQEAAQLGANLHLALLLSDNATAELDGLARELKMVSVNVPLIMVFHVNEIVTNEKWVHLARERLAALNRNLLIASGTAENFVEVNRSRPSSDSTALPCYSINPQIHAFDNTSMIENLGGQLGTVETTQQFCNQSIVISPITLRPQSDFTLEPGAASLPFSVDARQMSLFGAGWTLGSISRLSTATHIHSLTYFETTGWLGVMETEKGSPLPDKFPSRPGMVFPVCHLLADLADFGKVCPTHSSHPLQVEGLTLLDQQNRRRVLVANLLGRPQEVKIKTGTCRARIRYLDETNAEQAMMAPEAFRSRLGEQVEARSGKVELNLRPFALACVDIE